MQIDAREAIITPMSVSIAPFVPRLLLRVQDRTVWQATGTVVFADISGFTRLSEQLAELGRAGAEELTRILNATFDALLAVARSEGGDLVKFGGDALFLFFDGDLHAERGGCGDRQVLPRRRCQSHHRPAVSFGDVEVVEPR